MIMQEKDMSYIDTLEYLYCSKLYERLSEEETKFWHFSTAKLYEMLEIEKSTAILKIPDFY